MDQNLLQVSGTTSAASTNGHSSSNTKKDAKKGGIAGMFANAATKKADASKKEEIKVENNGTTIAGKADKKSQKVTHITYEFLSDVYSKYLLIIKKI